MNRRLYIAIGLLSASIIALQLVLMQILSISQWSHFAYMVISVALLGFGASGTALTFLKRWLLEKFDLALPTLMLLAAAGMAGIAPLSGRIFGGFDSYLIFIDHRQIYALAVSYLMLFTPFFFGAMAIGLVYMRHVSRIGTLYFADLSGSGLGGLLMLFVFWHIAPASLPVLLSVVPLAAALLSIRKRHLPGFLVIILPLAGLQLHGLLSDRQIPLSQYKSLARTLLMPGTEIVKEQVSPYGQLQLVESPFLRYAPGLSLTFTGDIPVRQALFNNGDWLGPVVSQAGDNATHFLDYATNALPFVAASPSHVLVLDAGTGLNTSHALANGARQLTAVEPNRAALALLDKASRLDDDRVTHVGKHSRSYLMADTSRYDLIMLPVIEGFGGSSGINALREQYLFTLESFSAMWNRLTPQGMIAVTVWLDQPTRNTLKMLASLVETVLRKADAPPAAHIAAIRSWGTVTFILQRSRISDEQAASIRRFCRSRNFDPLLLPDIDPDERMYFNQLQDETFFAMIDRIVAGDRESFYREYEFHIEPATDNRPYFSQFLKLRRLPQLRDIFGHDAVPFLEVGYLIVLLTFLQIGIIALLLIIAPLFSLGFRGEGRIFTLTHFSGIGVGFMFVEIVLIQQLTLFFGHPIYAAAAVLSGLLIFSGIGSFVSGKLIGNHREMAVYTAAIVVIVLLASVFLAPLLRAGIGLPVFWKIAITILLIGPLAFLMGLPFPSGLRLLARKNDTLVPWAWGVNGCLSVISAPLATIVAVEAGFTAVMLVGALAYFSTLLINYTNRPR